MKAKIVIKDNRGIFQKKDGSYDKPTEFWCEVQDYYGGEKPNTMFYSGPKCKSHQEAMEDAESFCRFKGMEMSSEPV